MRDPRRINKMLGLLANLWSKNPDLRFWQLIQILEIPKEKEGTDPFFWEDTEWETIFKNTLDKYSK